MPTYLRKLHCICLYRLSNIVADIRKVMVIPTENIHPKYQPDIHDNIEDITAIINTGTANIAEITPTIIEVYINLDKRSFILKV